MPSRSWNAIAGAWMLTLAANQAAAQTNSSIAGVVRDATGAVLPGVTVEAGSPALIEKVRNATTDETGQYRIIELRPGTYEVTFTLPGFSTFRREGIELTTGFTATVNAELRIGELSETVTVSGASPVLDIQNVVQQRVMTREVIDAIPTGKVFANLAALIPGTQVGGLGREQDVGGSAGSQNQTIAIHGGRNFDQVNLLDGMSVGQMEANGSVSSMAFPDGNVEEINLQVGAHSAEMETGGVRVNVIPKSGGNVFKASVFGTYTNERFQTDNLSDELRAQGLTSRGNVKYISDLNPSAGGPILRDRLWFHGGYRNWRTVRFSDVYADTNPADWVYTPDRSRDPIPSDGLTWNLSGRLTWQASPRNKLSSTLSYDYRCECHQFIGGTVTSEASYVAVYRTRVLQGTWVSPVTNRLLAEAGVSAALSSLDERPQPTAIAPPAMELNGGHQFRSRASAGYNEAYPWLRGWNYTARGSLSYVTGAHALKVGALFNPGTSRVDRNALGNYLAVLLNGTPNRVEYFPMPYTAINKARKLALFAQDQWTVGRWTLNGGLRFDWLWTFYPDVTLAATDLLPARSFPGADVLNWRDLSPRLGVAFDLFGNGRTAIKLSLDRYVAGELIDLTQAVHPAFAAGGRLVRGWTDLDADFVPDGEPLNPLMNGELGPTTNVSFGKPVTTLSYDPEWQSGWFKRGFNWEGAAGVEHQLAPGLAVGGSYFRRGYGNPSVIDNTLVAPGDYDPFCITAPTDSRLPGGGGQRICDLYDIRPSKLGLVQNLRTLASNYGEQYEYWHGIDVTMNARLSTALLQGGVSTGKTVIDNCDVVGKIDNPSPLYCHREQPMLAQLKLLGSLTFPHEIQFAATFQSIPITGYAGSFGVAASYVATNAHVAPTLGRNLAAGANGTVAVNVIEPGTMLPDRTNQMDVRVTRTFSLGRARLRGMLDLYNVLNSNAVLTWNNTYGTNGAAWLVPQQILQGRLVKLAASLDF
jgi:hypothetical protein